MKIVIPIQSINDIITNSSSEVIVLEAGKVNKEDLKAILGNAINATAYWFGDDYVKKYPLNYYEFDTYLFKSKASFEYLWNETPEEALTRIEEYITETQNMDLEDFYHMLSHLIVIDVDAENKNEEDMMALKIAFDENNRDAIGIHSFCWD